MYCHILLATDLTKEGREVARKAWELANQFDAKFSVIHVIEPIPAYGYPGVTNIASPYIDDAKKAMEDLGKQFMIGPENQYVVVGSTKNEILKKAEELETDLIVIGSHGRHGLARLLGSTVNSVLHGAKCDVMTVRFRESK